MRLSYSQRASAIRCGHPILSARQKRGQAFPAGHSPLSIQLNCIVVLALVVLMRAVLPRSNAIWLYDLGLGHAGKPGCREAGWQPNHAFSPESKSLSICSTVLRSAGTSFCTASHNT